MAEETKKEQDQTKINTEKQAKLKKQAELDTQDEKIKQEDPKALREKLSNKNSDYVFRLEKELQKQGSMSRADAVAMTNGLLSEIIIAQRHQGLRFQEHFPFPPGAFFPVRLRARRNGS